MNSCSICCELEKSLSIKLFTKDEKDMADDTKQDTSGFGTLLVIAEVMLGPIDTGACL